MAYSDSWRVNKSGVLALDTANILRSLDTVVGSLTDGSLSVRLAGMASGINGKPGEILVNRRIPLTSKEVPIAGNRVDVMTGQTVFAAWRYTHGIRDVDDKLFWIGRQKYKHISNTERLPVVPFMVALENVFLRHNIISEVPNAAKYSEQAILFHEVLTNDELKQRGEILDINNLADYITYTGLWGKTPDPNELHKELMPAIFVLQAGINEVVSNPRKYRNSKSARNNSRNLGDIDQNAKIDDAVKSGNFSSLMQDTTPSPGSANVRIDYFLSLYKNIISLLPDPPPAQPANKPSIKISGMEFTDQDINEKDTPPEQTAHKITDVTTLNEVGARPEDKVSDNTPSGNFAQDVQLFIDSNITDLSKTVQDQINTVQGNTRISDIRGGKESNSFFIVPKPDNSETSSIPELTRRLNWLTRIKTRISSRVLRFQQEGRLDRKNLHRYMIDGRNYRSKMKIARSDHDFVLLLDGSGSMSGAGEKIYMAARSAADALPRKKVKVLVYSTASPFIHNTASDQGNVVLNRLETGSTFNSCYVSHINSCGKLPKVRPSGGTPTTKAMLVAAEMYPKSVIIHFSDGDANSGITLKECAELIKQKHPKIIMSHILLRDSWNALSPQWQEVNDLGIQVRTITSVDEFPDALLETSRFWFLE